MNFPNEIAFKIKIKLIFYMSFCILLQGCSTVDFQKRLSNSFDSPLESENNLTNLPSEIKEQNEKLFDKKNVVDLPLVLKTNSNVDDRNNNSSVDVQKGNNSSSIAKDIQLKPYRIIIKLYGEDPSAPAEIVTGALRDAGVIFEVERIQVIYRILY